MSELIAWLKANPGKAFQGTNGPGSVMHLAGILLQRETGTSFQFVPYRGAGAAVQDLLAGNIDLYFGLPADILPHARSGKIKVFAVASPARLAAAPDTGWDRVVRVRVLLTRSSDFAEMNRIYAPYFAAGGYPARTTAIVSSLPQPGFLVEIECDALAY